MKEITTDIADVFEMPDGSELSTRLEIAIAEEDTPSLVLMKVLYDGERHEKELVENVATYLIEATGIMDKPPVNFSADKTRPQMIDYLAAKGPYFALMFQRSDSEQARAAFDNVKAYLGGKPGMQGVELKARVATHYEGQAAQELVSAAEKAELK